MELIYKYMNDMPWMSDSQWRGSNLFFPYYDRPDSLKIPPCVNK